MTPKKATILSLFVAALMPLSVSAFSMSDMRGQISTFLSKIAPSSETSVPAELARPSICDLDLRRPLFVGSRGEDVTRLQEFLYEMGHLQANATGYFGAQTKSAVASYQREVGLSPAGAVGPKTREHLRIFCQNPQVRFSGSPSAGGAPLLVTFKAKVQIANPQFVADAGYYKIDFGDGSEQELQCSGSSPWCDGPHIASHTYQNNGTYVTRLIHYGYFAPAPNSRAVGQKIIRVGGNIACTMEYTPVCAQPSGCAPQPGGTELCMKPEPRTYGNRCSAEADGATVLYSGECRSPKDPASDPMCRSWTDGCNSCSRQEPGGQPMCTLMLCRAGFFYEPPRCTSYFDKRPQKNRPPVISSLSGPVQLTVNEVGTWSIKASDPENGRLSYEVRWGDEWYAQEANAKLSSPSVSIIQETKLTHSYARRGNYTVQITVRDDGGSIAQASATVSVTRSECTGEYAPVCARPPGCVNNCSPGRYCTMVCQLPESQTYSNRCEMNNADAEFLYEGVCKVSQ